MNYHLVKYMLAQILKVEALLLLLPTLVSFFYAEPWAMQGYFLLTIGILLLISNLLCRKKPEKFQYYAREAFVIVALSWIFLSFFGSLPFYFSGQIPNLVDAFFETSSGFTTTGSTILADVESLSRSLLFWRSFTHFIGGMGVLVFALAILPGMGSSSVQMMKAEVPGPIFGKLVSKLHVTARYLYFIYVGMTGILVVLLLLGGMNLFDSLIHAFGAAGTGGFSNYNASVGHFQSVYIEMVLSVAMILFGMNFNLYYMILIGHAKNAFRSEELKIYLLIIGGAVLAISVNVLPLYDNFFASLRHSFFTVSSIITTTGYSTENFDIWPLFSRMILIFLMFAGAMAGSTGGGIKTSRLVIMIKSAFTEIQQVRQPNRVIRIRYEGKELLPKTHRGVANYFFLYVIFVACLTLTIGLVQDNFVSSFSAVMATFNNIGPGLEVFGPTGNYATLSQWAKMLLSFGMIAGRLEIFPILILFSPKTWERHL